MVTRFDDLQTDRRTGGVYRLALLAIKGCFPYHYQRYQLQRVLVKQLVDKEKGCAMNYFKIYREVPPCSVNFLTL